MRKPVMEGRYRSVAAARNERTVRIAANDRKLPSHSFLLRYSRESGNDAKEMPLIDALATFSNASAGGTPMQRNDRREQPLSESLKGGSPSPSEREYEKAFYDFRD